MPSRSPAAPLYPPINSWYFSASSATLKVVYSPYVLLPSKSSRSTLNVMSSVCCQMVKIVVSKPDLAVQISKPVFVGFPTKIEVNRSVQTSLENCPTSTVRGHVTQHLYWFAAIWTDCVHSTGSETNLEKFGAALDGLC